VLFRSQKLLERWNKCIAKHGDYVEKWYNCKVSAVVEINYKNYKNRQVSTVKAKGKPPTGYI
jgi:hypothetical protein